MSAVNLPLVPCSHCPVLKMIIARGDCVGMEAMDRLGKSGGMGQGHCKVLRVRRKTRSPFVHIKKKNPYDFLFWVLYSLYDITQFVKLTHMISLDLHAKSFGRQSRGDDSIFTEKEI